MAIPNNRKNRMQKNVNLKYRLTSILEQIIITKYFDLQNYTV